jgi:hypothetical protein
VYALLEEGQTDNEFKKTYDDAQIEGRLPCYHTGFAMPKYRTSPAGACFLWTSVKLCQLLIDGETHNMTLGVRLRYIQLGANFPKRTEMPVFEIIFARACEFATRIKITSHRETKRERRGEVSGSSLHDQFNLLNRDACHCRLNPPATPHFTHFVSRQPFHHPTNRS